MARRRRSQREDLIDIMYNFSRGNYSSIKFLNHTIDYFFEDNKPVDLSLHFLNEAVIHQSPELFVHNFIKYELLKKILGR